MTDRIDFAGLVGDPASVDVDLLCIPVFDKDDTLQDLPGIDAASGGALGRARVSGEFRSSVCDVFAASVVDPRWRPRRLLFVGAGPRDQADAERLRRVAATAGYAALARKARSVAYLVRHGADAAVHARCAADGLSAPEYDTGLYKSTAESGPPYLSVQIVSAAGDAAALADAARRGRTIGRASNLARALVNEPANVLTPAEFATRIASAAQAAGLGVEILDEQEIAALGMRLLLGVAQGSANPPRLVVLRYDPAGAPDAPVLGLVGKGVTFDTGGISIKPADGMERMRGDMAGGAAVAAAMTTLASLGGTRRVLGVIPIAENMPGDRATRPGDVIRGANGKTVEIINTDAEGRLILGDALWYARQRGATHVVDVATLTGAVVVALGRSVSALFGQPDAWVATVRESADRAGDRVWPMPIYEEAREQLASDIADLINSGGRVGGAVTAAAFLREFAGEGAWAHLDIAGTSWAEAKTAYQPKGPTGAAVRALIDLAVTAERWSGRRTG
jgi:leucyl aminopeptidase